MPHRFVTSPRLAIARRPHNGFRLRGRWALVLGLLVGASQVNAADTAGAQVAAWTVLAKTAEPGFSPSAERGRAFYAKQVGHHTDMNSCTACHTANPAQAGKHVVTSKPIAPMSPGVNPERFTDAAKTEKWFKRNCNDVLGRVCTPAEKADLVTYWMGVK